MKASRNVLALVTLFICFVACSKEYSAESGLEYGGYWQFNDGTKIYKGSFYDVYDTTVAGAGYALVFVGQPRLSKDTVLVKQILFPTGDIQPGVYRSSTMGTGFYFAGSKDTVNPVFIYTAEVRTVNAEMEFTISAYDEKTRIITGSFGGTAVNSSNTLSNISNGEFRARVR